MSFDPGEPSWVQVVHLVELKLRAPTIVRIIPIFLKFAGHSSIYTDVDILIKPLGFLWHFCACDNEPKIISTPPILWIEFSCFHFSPVLNRFLTFEYHLVWTLSNKWKNSRHHQCMIFWHYQGRKVVLWHMASRSKLSLDRFSPDPIIGTCKSKMFLVMF